MTKRPLFLEHTSYIFCLYRTMRFIFGFFVCYNNMCTEIIQVFFPKKLKIIIKKELYAYNMSSDRCMRDLDLNTVLYNIIRVLVYFLTK